MKKLDRAKADLLSKAPKYIKENIEWNSSQTGYKLRVRVIAPDINEVLELRGVVGRTNRSFSLFYRNDPIRRYCAQGIHNSPDGIKARGHHKHIWDEKHRDAYVYIPDDIDEGSDVNVQFFQFLREQNIECLGNYQHIMP